MFILFFGLEGPFLPVVANSAEPFVRYLYLTVRPDHPVALAYIISKRCGYEEKGF